MKILFYIEPLIEMGKPYFKEPWVNYFCLNILNTLKQSSLAGHLRFFLVMNEPLSDRFNNPDPANIDVIVLSQNELFVPFNNQNYLDITSAWYKGTYSEEQLEYYCHLMKSKIKNEPDIIVTFSPVPFLKKAYPKALVLHHEYSIFSRAPYPQTWYFDIAGMNGGAYLSKHWTKIQGQFQLTESNKNLLEDFKNTCTSLLLDKSPFKKEINRYRQQYDFLVLLPLQFSQFYLFDAHTHYKTQYDYLVDVLEKVPDNVGVIVTTHPDYNILSSDVVNYLHGKYKNFIYEFVFENYYSSSQYLLGSVDAVITVSSSVGLQTLIWDTKLISLGHNFLNFMSDSNTLDDIGQVLKKKIVNKDKVLFWILTRYSVQRQYLSNPEWLSTFLSNSLTKYRNNIDEVDFYDVIDSDVKKLFTCFKQNINKNIPEVANPVNQSTNLQIKKFEKSVVTEMLLLFDTGAEFSEELKRAVLKNEKFVEFELDFSKDINSIVFVPASTSVALKLTSVKILTNQEEKELVVDNTNASYIEGNKFYFFNDNPAFYFEVRKYPNIVKISLDFEYIAFGSQLKEILVNRVAQLEQKKNALEEEKQQIIFSYENKICRKLTRPLRKIVKATLRYFKNK